MCPAPAAAVETIVVIYDGREQHVPDLLAGVGVKGVKSPTHLDSGDYVLGEGMLAERKRVGQFLEQMTNGELGLQLKRLTEAADIPILIIEGDLEKPTGPDSAIPHKSRRSMVSFLVQFWGLWTIHTKDAEHTALWLADIARQAQVGARPPNLFPGKTKPRYADQSAILQSIRGIGEARALALLDRFGTALASLTASEDDLAAALRNRSAAKTMRAILDRSTASAAPTTPPDE